MFSCGSSLNLRKEVHYGSSEEGGLEEDHQAGGEIRKEEEQVIAFATVVRVTQMPRPKCRGIFIRIGGDQGAGFRVEMF